MKINTGKGSISIVTLISVLSLSLVVNIPGLAITPVLNSLRREFDASDLEVQLLTMLPNISIIPFMLLSNRFIERYGKTLTSVIALIVFAICGGAIFLSYGIVPIIIFSCLIGAACGVIIPIAASMVADMFVGKYRVKELGIKSGIANISLVFATFIVGWLSNTGYWRLPFLVYLLPIIPLLFTSGIHHAELISDWRNDTISTDTDNQTGAKLNRSRLAALMGLYFFVTYSVMALPYYLGLDEVKLHINNEWNGTITSVFYLMIFLGGVGLFLLIKVFKNWILIISALTISVGLIVMVSGVSGWVMCICGALMGFGYGVFQPIIYNKTAEVAQSKRLSTLALSWVMCMNYLSIAIAPIIIDSIRFLFNTQSNIFPFILNGILCLAFSFLIFLKRNSFAFSIKPAYY